MRNLHPNLSIGHGSKFDISLLNSLPSDTEYTSTSELDSSLETPPEYLTNQDDALDLTGNVTKLDVYPFDCGNTADIYRGELDSEDPTMVAIKIFRRIHTNSEELQRTTHRLYKEAKIWSALKHENILRCLGISRDVGPSPALISPLCSFGPVTKYLQKFTRTDGEKLQIIIGVARGLEYLHSHNVVHGSLSTTKILIDANEIPVICGYGMSKVLDTSEGMTSLIPSSIRFTAPEYFAADPGETGVKTTAGDVYAFAMVVLEIVSGARPYHDLSTDHTVLLHILRSGRPNRDKLLKPISDEIWHLLAHTWNQLVPFRPQMSAVVQYLESLKISKDVHFLSQFLVKENKEVRSPLWETYYKPRETSPKQTPQAKKKPPSKYSDASFPELSSLDLRGKVLQDDQFPFACGGNSNIYRGKILRAGRKSIRIVIKAIRISDDQQEDTLRRLEREISVWSRLRHKNLLPFIGVCHDIAPWPVLISPFYKYGHMRKYLSRYPNTNRSLLILGVADGLEYLHSQDVVHGDLKAANVLIDKRGNACISDFGISKVLGHHGFTTASVGTPPYMAPELFFVVDALDQPSFSPKTTKETDVYSFGLLVLEILTNEPPRRRPTRPIINSRDYANLHPQRSDYLRSEVSDVMWNVVSTCWALLPSARPSLTELNNHLEQIFHGDAASEELATSYDGYSTAASGSQLSAIPSDVSSVPEAWGDHDVKNRLRTSQPARRVEFEAEGSIRPGNLPDDPIPIALFAGFSLQLSSPSNDPWAIEEEEGGEEEEEEEADSFAFIPPQYGYSNDVSPPLLWEPCLRCKNLKVRCYRKDPSEPCKRCINSGHTCQRTGRSKKRGETKLSKGSPDTGLGARAPLPVKRRRGKPKPRAVRVDPEGYEGDVSSSSEE